MYTNNKLRQPEFNNKADPEARQRYFSKYEAAFQTCVFDGGPHTTTTLVGVTNQVYWIVSGELILLISSPCLFAWGTFVHNKLDTLVSASAINPK